MPAPNLHGPCASSASSKRRRRRQRAIGDLTYGQYLYSEMLAATDLFLSQGVKVVWVTAPRIESGRNQPPHAPYPESNPARMIRFNKMLYRIAVDRPGVSVVDLRAWLRTRPNGELDPGERPDGVHFTDDAALAVAGWLGPAILSAVRPLPAPSPAPAP